jgi:DNA-binding transcriptional MerR regulator
LSVLRYHIAENRIFTIVIIQNMNIKQFSQKTGLSSYTLRYYEKIGLITDVKRDAKGRRAYSESDADWIDYINNLKILGMPISDILRLVKLRKQGTSTYPERIKILEQHYEKTKTALEKLQHNLEITKCKINVCTKFKGIKYS